MEEFDAIYTAFEASVWRWQAHPFYFVPEEETPFAQWRAGEPDDLAWLADWLDLVRAATATGRTFQRVRRLEVPPTEFQRWSMGVAPANRAAGEDIRHLDGPDADRLGLPAYDFLIVDEHQVVKMLFTDGELMGAEVRDEPDVVAAHLAWRDLAWRHSYTV